MPRTRRNAPSGLVYHVLNRRVGRRTLFCKVEDCAATGSTNIFDEQFTYDGLDRLASFRRGTLVSGSITGSNIKFSQNWSGTAGATLDALGNWRGFVQDADGYGGAGAATN